MTKLFLTLDDAVKVAVKHFDIDPLIAEQQFEQKCYRSDDQYSIGYDDGLHDSIEAIKKIAEREG